MQRALTAQLANQSGLEVISFQHCDCLVFERDGTLKMFAPHSKRVLGGTAQDRIVIGDLLVIFDSDLEPLRSPSKRFKFANFATYVPIANFPSITESSVIVDGVVDEHFFRQVRDLLMALPSSKLQWHAKFGEDFFTRPLIDRCIETVRFLRKGS